MVLLVPFFFIRFGAIGASLGSSLGTTLDSSLGTTLGLSLGTTLGLSLGSSLGPTDNVGSIEIDGAEEGIGVGATVVSHVKSSLES
jgi:hypothetical protein